MVAGFAGKVHHMQSNGNRNLVIIYPIELDFLEVVVTENKGLNTRDLPLDDGNNREEEAL